MVEGLIRFRVDTSLDLKRGVRKRAPLFLASKIIGVIFFGGNNSKLVSYGELFLALC